MCGDEIVGVMTARQYLRTCLILAKVFQKWEDKYIGVMFPSSVGAYLIITALQLVGKVPVMFNWTAGPKALASMQTLSGASKVITSTRFLDRLKGVSLEPILSRLFVIEEIKETISWRDKLCGVRESLSRFDRLAKIYGLDRRSGEDEAVILFTSGTESAPKGVPLTHTNILENLRSSIRAISFEQSDILFSMLPPFHSFGFSVTGLFPLLAGIRVAFTPDPTDSQALVDGVFRWKATLFCSAPSFLKGVLAVADKERLRSLRLIVVGAEKAPEELFQKVAILAPQATMIEGYGITECAPVLTMVRLHEKHRRGVGSPIDIVAMRMIHPETLQPLAFGEEGEVCVQGPNVFHGYLGQVKSPFIELDQSLWYRTGDLGYFDRQGSLILSGRLKRFVKIGGEMISLGAVEEVLSSSLTSDDPLREGAPLLAVCADEAGAKPLLIVFATSKNVTKEKANEILKGSGLSRLVKIASVEYIQAIPLMGTGKIDYRTLQSYLSL
jgi:long-chain-fatty-acid--[acyl-carrier-protein] ligase